MSQQTAHFEGPSGVPDNILAPTKQGGETGPAAPITQDPTLSSHDLSKPKKFIEFNTSWGYRYFLEEDVRLSTNKKLVKNGNPISSEFILDANGSVCWVVQTQNCKGDYKTMKQEDLEAECEWKLPDNTKIVEYKKEQQSHEQVM